MFPIKIVYKARIQNRVVDAFEYESNLIDYLIGKDFDYLEELYEHDEDFSEVWKKCHDLFVDDFYIHYGFFVKGNQLCIPRFSLQ